MEGMISPTIEIGDVVQEKEGNRRNGLVLEFRTKYLVRGKEKKSVPYKSARILWPDGKQNTYKLSFLEKMF